MIPCRNHTKPYAKALYVATPQDQLQEPEKPKKADGVSASGIAKMEREMQALEKDFRLVEESYGTNMLNLVVTRNYLARLLDNARVVKFLARGYPELFAEFQRVAEAASLEG